MSSRKQTEAKMGRLTVRWKVEKQQAPQPSRPLVTQTPAAQGPLTLSSSLLKQGWVSGSGLSPVAHAEEPVLPTYGLLSSPLFPTAWRQPGGCQPKSSGPPCMAHHVLPAGVHQGQSQAPKDSPESLQAEVLPSLLHLHIPSPCSAMGTRPPPHHS